jgi:GNAT superfamily N-acetyltransferase
MIEPTIRPAMRDDLPGVLALYRHLHPDDPKLELTVAEPAWSSLLSSGLTTLFVADAAGLLASSCTLAIIPNLSRGGRPYGVIENMVTHPDFRRAGLGRAVLQAALDAAWKADCYKVMLATGSRQEATSRFYEGAGFSRDGKTCFEVRRSQHCKD